jgi:hypothetical protein
MNTFYTLFESYLPYMPLADTLESLSRGTLSELVLTCREGQVRDDESLGAIGERFGCRTWRFGSHPA